MLVEQQSEPDYHAAVHSGPAALFALDARWLSSGPPSGHRYVRNLTSALAAGPEADAFVAFIRGARDSCTPGIRCRRLPNVPGPMFNLVAIPLATPRRTRAVLYQNFAPFVGRGAAVTVVHDLIFLEHPEQFSAIERAYLALIPMLLPRSAMIVTVSEHVRRQVLERWPRRDPGTVVSVPNGVGDHLLATASADDLHDRQAAFRQARSLDRPYVAYLGRLTARKNLARLIRAHAHALPEYDLAIAGAASGVSDDLTAVAQSAGIGDRLRLLGPLRDDEVPAFLAGADLFAYVSLAEGFGVPPLEAMAFGLPVVASSIPALTETAAPGGAIMVEPADVESISDGLRMAARDPLVRDRARTQGPRYAATFRWGMVAERIVAVMRQASGTA
jgi:glycosyltransferase involved in cell wall biosynthesis